MAVAWGRLGVLLVYLVTYSYCTYSNSFEVEAVTTFAVCANASSIDPVTQAAVCINDTAPITVIEYFVLPGQDDAAGGSEMAFYTYPQPFTNQPVNQQNGAPPDNPCQQASATTNCTWFGESANQTGPIIMTAKVSSVVRKYKVVQILDGNSAPYSYLNYAATVPKCSAEFCTNQCSNNKFNQCNPSTDGNTASSFYACCAIQDDYVGAYNYRSAQCENGGFFTVTLQGNLFAQANELYDYNENRQMPSCGAGDMNLLYNYGQGFTKKDQPAFERNAGCRACPMIYDYRTKFVANRGINHQSGDGCPKTGSSSVSYDLPYPTTMPDLCPVPGAHVFGYPATTGDRESGADADKYVSEPYYYWCQANCVGTASYTTKYLEYKDSPTKWYQYASYCDVNGDANGQFPVFQQGSTESLDSLISVGGEQQDMYAQYMRGYECTINPDVLCPQLSFAANVIDTGGYACCNTTFDDNGNRVNTCNSNKAGNPGADLPQSCGGIAYAQVQGAISYLTAACDAEDSGESICGQDCFSGYTHTDNSWKCPGFYYDHITPRVAQEEWEQVTKAYTNDGSTVCTSANSCQSMPSSPGLYVTKCSAECSSDPFIRYSSKADNTCSGSTCRTNMESNTAQKAIVNLGGPTCQVYQVLPQPILDVSIEITFTGPDNSTATTFLSSDGSEPAFGQATLDGVVFSTRINKVDTIGAAGPQIGGYFVVCGMNSYIPKDTDCVNLQNSVYNPYDPTNGDPTISIPKPGEDTFCIDHGGDVKQFRGIFPGNIPQENPWPQLIQKMVEARTQSGDPPPTGKYSDEGFACAVPSHRYYGVLNCGKPVSYYYVPEEQKSSYGLDCGQVGVQNNYAFDISAARRMCLQDENSCTPGYGLPKFTASNAPFFRSPCQQIGDMVKTFHNLFANPDGNLNVCEHNTPAAWNMPGFTYLKNTDQYVPPGSKTGQNVVGVPNTWFHEGYIYQQMSASEQQSVRFDMSTYTDTYFGGNLITYSGGILVLDQGNTTVCVANVGSQPGILVVGVENTNIESGGTYVMQLACTNPQNNDPLDVNTTGGEAVIQPDGSGTQLIQVAAGDTRYVTWGISANGYIPPPDSDTDTPASDPDSIGLPTCTITLYSGPIAQPTFLISKLTINCNLLALNIIQSNRQTDLLTSIETSYNCGEYSLVVLPFCWLTNMGPIRSTEILLIFVCIGIASGLLGYLGLQELRSKMELEVETKNLTTALHDNELTKERRQTLSVQAALKSKT